MFEYEKVKIGQRIKELRKSLKMTQEDLRKRLKYKSVSSISMIENGRFEPSTEAIKAIADVLGTSPEYLLFGESMTPEEEAPKLLPIANKSLPLNVSGKDLAELFYNGYTPRYGREWTMSTPDLFGYEVQSALMVTDDSMKLAGIEKGNIVYIKSVPPEERKNNFIGVFQYGDDILIRRFSRQPKNKIMLLIPESRTLKPLVLPLDDSDLVYIGEVVAILKRVPTFK